MAGLMASALQRETEHATDSLGVKVKTCPGLSRGLDEK